MSAVAVLQEACQLHCLCRRANNEDRPMICCDACNGWFHYDCVGLPLPHRDDAGPREFCCPVCSAKVRPAGHAAMLVGWLHIVSVSVLPAK